MNWTEWFKYYFLNIDALIAVCIFAAAVYFVITQKRKKCKFMGLDGKGLNFKSKKKKGKSMGAAAPKPKKRKLNKHEEECRRIFQELFGTKFKSVRPDWLKNPTTKKNLELDGFCPHIETPKGVGLAFEYDGEQHSKFNSHFHKSGHDEFIYQVKKDTWKDLKCRERGVALVRIPHFVAFTDLRRYIVHELKRQGISIPMIHNISSNYHSNREIGMGNMYN
jgi:hypothetical protein